MTTHNAKDFSSQGIQALNKGNSIAALAFFEKAVQIENTALNRSYLAYCMAKERGQFKKAVSLCDGAMKEEPANSIHYLNLGKIYLLHGSREEAIRIYRDGLKFGDNPQILDELINLGIRKKPVISFLSRNNPLNKYLGLLLTRLGLR